MKIEIETPYNMWADSGVAVVVDGFCNHGNLEQEESNPTDPDERSESILMCRKCGAWRYVNNFWGEIWYDEKIILKEKI